MSKAVLESKTPPLQHQKEAVSFLLAHKTAALFDEQGVGKTKEIIDSITEIMKAGDANSSLIICPKTLTYTWKNEINKHSYLASVVIDGVGKDKGYKLLSPANIFVINYEGVKANLDVIKMLLKSRPFVLVLDESQRIKNPGSETFKAINEIKDLAVRKFILSGTPVANQPEDIWAQFYFLDGGETLGKDFKEFKQNYGSKAISTAKMTDLQEKIRSVSLRRLKQNVLELPEKVYETIEVKMATKQNEIYQKLRKELLVEVLKTDEKTIVDESESILKKLLRLVQIASNPGLVVMDYTETPSKFSKLDELVKGIIKDGEKVIMWSSFVDNIKILKDRYSDYGSINIHGSVPIPDRNRYVDLFQNNPNYKIMVANPAAAREGLTLTAANNAIYLDRTFNLVDYLQSQDRIHRISQNKKCRIIKLIAKDSIDVFIEDRLSKKHNIAQVIQGDSEKYDEDKYLTKEQILEILN